MNTEILNATSAGAAAAPEARAAAFATAVRERLNDLPADDVDELLDGLQGDLTERLTDGGTGAGTDRGDGGLGDPEAYADELRQAAGLPPRGEAPTKNARKGVRSAIRESWTSTGRRFVAYWAAKPERRAIRDFIIALRPVWWVARGIVLAWLIAAIFYGGSANSFPVVLLAALLVVVSVQWGRGAWAPKQWLIWLRRVASAVAAIALIPAMGILWGNATSPTYVYEGSPYQSGLSHDGTQIGNIFAYDCNGEPLNGVQLFTRDGEPLTTLEDGNPPWAYDDEGGNYQYEQNPLVTLPNGWDGWNVFPLQQAKQNEYSGELGPAIDAEPPFAKVPALSEECPAPVVGGDLGEGGSEAETGNESSADPSSADDTGLGIATEGE